MKLNSQNTAIVDVSLGKLAEKDRKRFEDMLLRNDVKFNYDIQQKQYVALLKIDKNSKSMSKSKSVTAMTTPKRTAPVTARTQKHFHQDCGELFLEPRQHVPVKIQTSPVNTAGATDELKRTGNHHQAKSRSRSPNMPKPKSVINLRNGDTVVQSRLQVLANYQHCFPQVDLSKILFTPIHLSKLFLMRKIEFFYNKQFEALNRYRVPSALHLSKVIYDFLLSKYKTTPNYYLQSLANLLYSVDRHHAEPEIDLFQQFLGEKPGSLRLLFYIYVRQVFKIVTSTFFLNHKSTEEDPSRIRISKENVVIIVEQALHGKDQYIDDCLRLLGNHMGSKSSINYYKFMALMTKVSIDYYVC
jgi:hypothetical protein